MGRKELDQIIKVIKKVREPGESPSQSTTSLDLFECDLCKGDVEKSKLTQCSYCGRWICKENCWNNTNLACTSCSSIIQLAGRKEDNSYNESETKAGQETKKQGFLSKLRKKDKNVEK